MKPLASVVVFLVSSGVPVHAASPRLAALPDASSLDASSLDAIALSSADMPTQLSLAPPLQLVAPKLAAVVHDEPSIGVGLQLGAPTAVTIKLGAAKTGGLVLGLGAGFGYGASFGASLWLHADYLFHLWTIVDVDGFDLSIYAGPGLFGTAFGARYGIGYSGPLYFANFDYIGFGVRLPVGLSMAFDGMPLELYTELEPAMSVFPGFGIGMGASLGFRFYF